MSRVAVMCMLTAGLMYGCSKNDSNSGNPTAPTATTTPAPANPGTVVSQNGCSVTYACPNVDINGVANPTTPTFDRLTVSNGTSSGCRVDSYRNERPNPGDSIPIEFTIRNPGSGFSWSAQGGNCQIHFNDPRNPQQESANFSGSAGAAGPFQARAGFGGPGSSTALCDGRQLRSGDTFTQPLNLEIRRSGGDNAVVAACGVTLWGYVTPNK